MNIAKKNISGLAILGLAVVFSLALVPNQALAMSDASSTLSTSYGGRLDSDHQLSFEAGATLVVGGRIGIVFPASFRLGGTTSAGETTVNSSTITVSSATVATATTATTANDTTLTLWLAAVDGVDALSGTTVHISGISVAYPASGGSHQLNVRTIDTSGDSIEEASSTAFSIIAVNIAESQTQTAQITVAPPSSKITSPTFGASIAAGQDYTIKGTASDLGVKDVSKVEVSVDGGSTWVGATLTKVSTGNYTWEYTWANPSTGTYTIKSRATDTASNQESPGLGVSVTVSAAAPEAAPVPTTVSELQAKITELQQKLVSLLQQLIQLLTQQLQSLTQ